MGNNNSTQQSNTQGPTTNYTDNSTKITNNTTFNVAGPGLVNLPPACAVNCEGGGGTCANTMSQAYSSVQGVLNESMSAGAGASASANASGGAAGGGQLLGGLLGGGGAGGGAAAGIGGGGGLSAGQNINVAGSNTTQSTNAQNAASCPNNINQKLTTNNISNTLMSVNQSTMVMNQSSLSSISSAVNQMIVNSITTTTSSSQQNINISQSLAIRVSGVQGNVTISNIKQSVVIDCTNTVSMDLSAIDNVRADLANQILQQFATATNTTALDSAQTSILTELKNNNETSNKLYQTNSVRQVQAANVPVAVPLQPIPPTPGANVSTDQTSNSNATASTIITAPYTQSNNINRSIQSSILNSVTQNFTHETVTQLISAININQSLGIDVANVAGNVDIKNIEQTANVILVSTLNQHMSIGTAIVGSITSALGATTDDIQTIKKSNAVALSDTTNLRSTTSGSTDTSSTFSYEQSLTTSVVPMAGASGGSSISSFLLCALIIIMPLLSRALPSPQLIVSSPAPTTTSTASTEGGYYFY